MAGGGAAAAPGVSLERAAAYKSRFTWILAVTILLGASGGLLFGYDNGVTGGVTAMHAWQAKFFPSLLSEHNSNSPYCKYDNQGLQFFTSCLYLAGAFAALVGSWTTSHWGRRTTMILAGAAFLAGSVLQAAAVNLAMLYIGRIVLGVGVGLANQSVPVFLSETAPYHLRGACNTMFQLAVTIGILGAQLINYRTQDYSTEPGDEGWRYSLGFAGVPALILLIGSLCLPDTPNGLVERGKLEAARTVLERCRGTKEVDAEYDDIVDAARAAALVPNPWRTITTRKYRPQLVLSILIPIFQQLTGINAIVFYSPQILSAIGGADAALLNTVIIGSVNVGATIVALVLVDKLGRKALFLEGGVQMFATQVITAVLLGTQFAKYGPNLPTSVSKGVLAVICIFVGGFAWSWGPLAWLVPTEIQPLETRSAGQSINVFFNFLLTFIIGQAFLSMLCSMEFGIFLFFAGWVVIMTVFTSFFLPETKNVPIEEVPALFATHWFWRRVLGSAPADDGLSMELPAGLAKDSNGSSEDPAVVGVIEDKTAAKLAQYP